MGETGNLAVKKNIYCCFYLFLGCGKTKLLSFLCQIILDDELEIFRMHAGINVKKILDTMSDFIIKAHECEL